MAQQSGGKIHAPENLCSVSSESRTTISVSDDIVGVGDSKEKKDSERIAALSGVLQLIQSGQVSE